MIYPRVTVLVAHHNYHEYLAGCIGSVKNQTYKNIKTCIVDSSSDKQLTKDICKQNLFVNDNINHNQSKDGDAMWDNNGNLLICLNEAKGPSVNRNIGIINTIQHTDIFAILDADDEMYPNKVQRCVDVIIKDYETIGAVYADHDTHNVHSGKTVREYREPYDIKRLVQECIIHSGSCVTSKALMECKDQYGFYDVNMRTCEDYDLWMRISEKFMIMHIAEPLTFVRVHNNNSTYSVNKNIWNKNWQRVHQKRYERHQIQQKHNSPN